MKILYKIIKSLKNQNIIFFCYFSLIKNNGTFRVKLFVRGEFFDMIKRMLNVVITRTQMLRIIERTGATDHVIQREPIIVIINGIKL